jgi:ABC-type polysaccharide/polyol phosphate transport system ATPase subunit
MSISICLQGVSKFYQCSSIQALSNLDLIIYNGQSVGIIGENGSGKSTLLKLISGDILPSEGVLTVNGAVETLFDAEILSHPDQTPFQIASLFLELKGASRSQRNALMEDIEAFCRLGKRFYDPFYTLSLGMKSRVQFAVKTSIHKEIVLVDEVLGAGDITTAQRSAERIRSIANDSTFICVSHSLSQIRDFCERVIWIRDGRLAMDGTSSEVLPAYEAYMQRRIESLYSRSLPLPLNVNLKDRDQEQPDKAGSFGIYHDIIQKLTLQADALGLPSGLKMPQAVHQLSGVTGNLYAKACNLLQTMISSVCCIAMERNVIVRCKGPQRAVREALDSLGDGDWLILANVFNPDRYEVSMIHMHVYQTNNSDPPALLLSSNITDHAGILVKPYQSSAC